MNSPCFNFTGWHNMFFNVLVALFVLLLLQGQVNAKNEHVGYGQHILNDKKVTLAKGSIHVTKENFEQYKSKLGCDVDFDADGNIVLHYKKQGSAAKNGCTLDLLTSNSRTVVFYIMPRHAKGGPSSCVTQDVNHNVLPFVYSISNEELKKFNKGPEYTGLGGDCIRGCPWCIGRTGLEVGWVLGRSNNIKAIANPIGSEQLYSIEFPMEQMESQYTQLIINENEDSKYFLQFGEGKKEKAQCMFDDRDSIISPLAWEINNGIHEHKNYFLAFHLLPQSATRIKKRMRKEYIILNESPRGGPKCDDLQIIFDKSFYSLVVSDLSPPTTTTTTTSKKPTPPGPKPPPKKTKPPGPKPPPKKTKPPGPKPPPKKTKPPKKPPLPGQPQAKVTTSTSQPDNFGINSTIEDTSDNSTLPINEDATNEVEIISYTTKSSKSTKSSASASVSSATKQITTSTAAGKSSPIWIIIAVVVVGVVAFVAICLIVLKCRKKKEKSAEGGEEEGSDKDGEEIKKDDEEKKEGDEEQKEGDDEKSKEEGDGGEKKKGTESEQIEENKEGKTGATSANAEENSEEEEEEGEKQEPKILTPEEAARKKEEDEIYRI